MPWRRWAAVAASASVTHAAALGGGYVWLDHAHIEGGLAIAPPARWPALFTQGFAGTGFYRPLMALSLSVDALLGGPLVFHAVSIAWHAAAAVLVGIAGEALSLSRRAATIAALLFAVHPVTSLVADAVAFRSEAMIAVALLALVWAHERRRPALAAAAIVFGALTKETALLLAPLFVTALEVSRAPRDLRARRDVLLAEGAALCAAAGVRAAFAPAWRASFAPLPVGDAVGTRLAAVAKSVASVVLPVDRSICDAFRVTHLWSVAAIAGAVAIVAVVAGAWKRRGPALLLALALVPSLHLVPVARWWSPHYVYVPLAFGAMLAGEAAERLRGRARLAGVAVLVLLGAVTLHDGRRFASDLSLWIPEVEAQPACREGQFYLGDVARSSRHWDAAAKRYEAALATTPDVLSYVDRRAALQNLGTVRIEQRRFADARAAFLTALEGTADEAARRELTHDLAAATLAGGDPSEAARLLEGETTRSDVLPESLIVRALALERLGLHEEARALRARLPRTSR